MTHTEPTAFTTKPLGRLAGALAALPLCAVLAAPAAAAPIFEFEITGTFSGAVINGTAIDKAFTITGQTLTTGHSGVPGIVNPVLAPLDVSSLTLSYDGVEVANSPFMGQATWGLAGGPLSLNMPPIYEFTGSSLAGPFDLKPQTREDSIAFEFTLEGETVWVGFGGEGRNMGITISQDSDGVVLFGEPDSAGAPGWLTRPLLHGANTRSVTYTPAPAAPIPLPAAGWLLLGGLGGLGLLGRRRKAQTG